MADQEPEQTLPRVVNRGLQITESVVYGLAALLLIAGALILLGEAAYELVTHVREGAEVAVETTLDTLLLVFVLVELLGAVRATVRERKLVAEPFLVVGIIVSIKEIVVVAIDAKENFGAPGGRFEDAMIEIGVLGALLLSLSLASFLMRRKEREPSE